MRVSMHSSQHMPTDFRGSRSGATLTEVLISLLAMGIGVVAVATMFPISVLKSVRATQLTRAAILSMNANSQIHADQRFLNDPDFYRDSLSGAPYDSESKGPFEHFSEDINGNGRLDQGEDFDGNGVLNRGIYMVDPLGWAYNNSLSNSIIGTFGNNGPSGATGFPRFHGMSTLAPTENAARDLVGLPDSWETVGEDVLTAIGNNTPSENSSTLTFPSTTQLDFSVITTGATPPSRVILFLFQPNGGAQAITRRIADFDDMAKTIKVTPAIPGAGGAITAATIDRVRVETQQLQFTWMLTVRKSPHGTPLADVVIFYNRSFDPDDERLYAADFITAANADGVTTLNDVVNISWSTVKPNYKRGNFIFSTANGEWYRIINVLGETATGATLQLNRPVKALPTALPATADNAILPRGVIDVFPYKAP